MRIIVLSDGDTWESIGGQHIIDITDEEFHQLFEEGSINAQDLLDKYDDDKEELE
jgi:hypothetical protein